MRDLQGRRTRPDAAFSLHPTDLHIDVSVVGVHAKSNVGVAAVERRERQKRKRYAASVAAEGGVFRPFVVDSHGRWGADANATVDLLAEGFTTATGGAPRRFVRALRAEVSVALQRGNAQIALAGAARMRTRPHRPAAAAAQGTDMHVNHQPNASVVPARAGAPAAAAAAPAAGASARVVPVPAVALAAVGAAGVAEEKAVNDMHVNPIINASLAVASPAAPVAIAAAAAAAAPGPAAAAAPAGARLASAAGVAEVVGTGNGNPLDLLGPSFCSGSMAPFSIGSKSHFSGSMSRFSGSMSLSSSSRSSRNEA